MKQHSSFAAIIKSVPAVLAGNFLYALTITVFLLPAGLVVGGTTGIGLTLNHLWNIPLSAFVLVFNIAMLLLGMVVLGKAFVANTLLSTFLSPIFLELCQQLWGDRVLTDDLLLSTVFSGLGIGISVGIVIRAGASTGGMDIPPLILKKLFRVPVSTSLYVFDFCILLMQAMFRPMENVLYGLILVMIYTMVLDKLLLAGHSRTELKIISTKVEELREGILSKIDRGVTLLEGEGGYSKSPTKVILMVIANRELTKVEKIIHSIDPESMIIVNRVSEVQGRGFSLSKRYLDRDDLEI